MAATQHVVATSPLAGGRLAYQLWREVPRKTGPRFPASPASRTIPRWRVRPNTLTPLQSEGPWAASIRSCTTVRVGCALALLESSSDGTAVTSSCSRRRPRVSPRDFRGFRRKRTSPPCSSSGPMGRRGRVPQPSSNCSPFFRVADGFPGPSEFRLPGVWRTGCIDGSRATGTGWDAAATVALSLAWSDVRSRPGGCRASSSHTTDRP